MKKTILILIAASVGAHALNAEDELIFESDFAPGEAGWSEFPADDGIAPPGWLANAFDMRWPNDPGNAAAESNGYFGEVFRLVDPGQDPNLDQSWWMSQTFPAAGGLDYTVSFDIKTNTDDDFANNGEVDGIAEIFVRYFQDGNIVGQDIQELIVALPNGNGGPVIGDEGFAGERDEFDEVIVGTPDANGWRTVTLRGSIPSNANQIDLWFVGLAGTDNVRDLEDPVRFYGSFGIDHVELVANVPSFENPVDITIHPALQIEFFAEEGRTYLTVSTSDLNEPRRNWGPLAPGVVAGQGEPFRQFISVRDNPRQFFLTGTD